MERPRDTESTHSLLSGVRSATAMEGRIRRNRESVSNKVSEILRDVKGSANNSVRGSNEELPVIDRRQRNITNSVY